MRTTDSYLGIRWLHPASDHSADLVRWLLRLKDLGFRQVLIENQSELEDDDLTPGDLLWACHEAGLAGWIVSYSDGGWWRYVLRYTVEDLTLEQALQWSWPQDEYSNPRSIEAQEILGVVAVPLSGTARTPVWQQAATFLSSAQEHELGQDFEEEDFYDGEHINVAEVELDADFEPPSLDTNALRAHLRTL